MKTIFLSGLLLASFLIGSNIYAQAAFLGPQVGYYKAEDADNGRLMGGAAFRLRLTPGLGAEASINYRQEKYGHDEVTVRSWPVLITGLLYPLPIIYAAAGAGWYNTTYDYSDYLNDRGFSDNTRQEFGWHFGAGAEIPLRHFSLVGDIRYVFIDYDFKQVPGLGDVDSNFYIITGAVLFRL